MTHRECNKGDIAGTAQSEWLHADWSHGKKNVLITIAPLFLLAAIMSQSFIGYYAADYYAQQPKQQGLHLEAIKDKALSLGNKTMKGVSFADVENLIKFNCKK